MPVPEAKKAPPNCSSPAPVNAIVALPVLLVSVTLPETITVPVEIVIRCLAAPPPFENATLAAFKVPAPTAIVFVSPVAAALGMVMAPETVNATPELMLTVVLTELVRNVSEAQVSAVSTVTVVAEVPETMTTASPENGTT
ncbi:MAG: hypothetical protein ACLQU3_04625 [Limisphaerales bacterium]